MISFCHPNVMPLIGMCIDGEVPLLIMPFMSGGSVLNYVTKNRENLHFIDDTHAELSMSTSLVLYRIVLIFRGSKFSRIAALKEFVE